MLVSFFHCWIYGKGQHIQPVYDRCKEDTIFCPRAAGDSRWGLSVEQREAVSLGKMGAVSGERTERKPGRECSGDRGDCAAG